jgi:hypothetical protein
MAMLQMAANSGRPRSGHGFDLVAPIGSSYHCEKGGYLWTSQNGISFDVDGIGIAICYNGVNDAVLFQQAWPNIRAAIQATTWPARANYFRDFGMPAF